MCFVASCPVFHVTDQLGKKLTDQSLLNYIQQALCATRRNSKDVQTCPGREVRPCHVSTGCHTALEMTVVDRPGLLSEVLAVLAELGCYVNAAAAWTHNKRAACIIYVEDEAKRGLITDSARLAHIQEQLQNVVEAHHREGEKRSVRLTTSAGSRTTHTDRRLHQLMSEDEDYEMCGSCGSSFHDRRSEDFNGKSCGCTHITIENCKEKGYSVVNIRSSDRPKLLFDTVCTLTDLEYDVFHATVSSKCSIAVQEYYVRRKDGRTLNSENERRRVAQCLSAAVERRASEGLRLDISANNKIGLLSDITRVFREYGLSVSSAEIGTKGERAEGRFYVTGASGHKISPETLESVKQDIDGTVKVISKPSSARSRSELGERSSLFCLRSILWSHLGRLSNNSGSGVQS
ncbi:hypothetical protein Dimus_017267 [Dionaea muscipula]